MFNQICGFHCLAKLTRKISYHTDFFYNAQNRTELAQDVNSSDLKKTWYGKVNIRMSIT